MYPTANIAILTPSLPWCHLKTTSKSVKFETFVKKIVSFSHWHVKGLLSQCIAFKVAVTGLEDILFAGTSLRLSAWTFYRLGQWRLVKLLKHTFTHTYYYKHQQKSLFHFSFIFHPQLLQATQWSSLQVHYAPSKYFCTQRLCRVKNEKKKQTRGWVC